MSHANAPSSTASPQGRRVLVAIVNGAAGERIQAWRERHDPTEAERVPPHTTLCYWPPTVEPAILEQQVRHAFEGGVSVRLGEVHQFESDQHTFYVEVLQTAALDRARLRLYDGRFVQLPELREWPWHVSCIRDSRGRAREALCAAAEDLAINDQWRVDTVAYLELRGRRYESLATWTALG